MEERHKALLRDKRLEITSDLRFRDIRQRLLDSEILNDENLMVIESQQSRVDQAKALLDILPTRGPNAFAEFRGALKHRYPHLARILIDEDVSRYFFFVKEKVSSDWKDLAFYLDLDEPGIANIANKNPDDKSRCMDMLQHWLRRKGDDATLEVLMTALSNAGLKNVADGLRKKFPAAIQALLYLTPSPPSSESGSSDEETSTKDQDTGAAGVTDERRTEDKLKDEKAKQLELLRQVGENQLALLKKADLEGLLSREIIERKTEKMLDDLYQSSLHILQVKMGCAILHLVPQSLDALDRFWRDYKTGQLTSNFSNSLITDEMRTLGGPDLALEVMVLGEQNREWAEHFKAGEMQQTVEEFESLTMTPAASRTPSVSAATWETFVNEYLPGNTEQVKLLLDSAWRDPVVELVVLIPFFWPHIVTYWLEKNHTFPQTLTELLQYSVRKHFARQTGNVSVSEQESASLSETITESMIRLGSKGLDSIVQNNCREIDLNEDERKSLDPAVFGLLNLTETERYTFVNTFLHDFCVALCIKDTLDRTTDMAVFQQLVQNAGRMPLVCFFTSGLLVDRAGDFLSALAKSGVFNSPFQKVETCLIGLAETSHVQSLYQCVESVYDGGVLDVSSESVLSLLFSSAAIRFINQSHVVQSVRLCDRSKLKKEESNILSKLETNPDEESVWLSSDFWSDVSDRKFILLLMQCIPLLSAVRRAGSKSGELIMCKIPLRRFLITMLSPGIINRNQLFQLVQAMKHMCSLNYLDLRCNYVEDDLVGYISPSNKYCNACKLRTNPIMMLMSSLPRLASLQELELRECSFLSAAEVDVLCGSIKGSWQLVKLNITVLQSEWNDMMGAAIGKLFLRLPNLTDLKIDNNCTGSETVLVHALMHLGALKNLQKLAIRVKMSDEEAKALAVSLQHAECLEEFQLRNCGISDTGCTAIAEVFVNMRSLKMLNLSSNQISVSSVKSLAAHIGHLSCLEDLDLSHNKLSDDGCIVIAEAFHKMRSILKRLRLTRNNISVSGAIPFATHVSHLSCLEHLDLSGNKLSDDGCIVIAEAFHKMKSVHNLILSVNDISDRGGTVLMGKINLLTHMHMLHLYGNKMTDAVAQLVVDAMRGMDRLMHVDLSYNRFSSEGVEILKQNRNILSSGQHAERYLHRHDPLEIGTPELFLKGTESHTSSLSKLSAPYWQTQSEPSSSYPTLSEPSPPYETLSGVKSRYEISKVESDIETVGSRSVHKEAEVAETSKETERR